MKKFLSIIYIFLVLTLSSGHVFPDRLPDWKKINEYSPEKLQFQKTSLEQFKTMCPGSKSYDFDKQTVIVTVKPLNIDSFSEINVGFRNKALDWLEFVLAKQIDINELINVYGLPENIDTKYSDTLDYYNYDTFSIAADKKHAYANSISVFASTEPGIKNSLRSKIGEATEKRFFEMFPELKPGVTIESEFAKSYPDLLPYTEGEFDVNSTYTLVQELEEAGCLYEKALLKFENGLLVWINLVPQEAEARDILKRVKSPLSVEKIDDRHDFYVFDNFVLTVDKEQNRVSNVGLVDFDKQF